MKLVFLRHGESVNNRLEVVSGRSEDGLSDEGIEQALRIGAMLDTDFDIIFSSILRRTRQTVGIINRFLRRPIETRLELSERDYGTLSRKTWDEIKDVIGPDAKTKDRNLGYDYRPWGGESVDEVRMRLLAFIAYLSTLGFKKVLIVTHGGIIRLMYDVQKKSPPSKIENCSVHEFEI